MLRKSFVMKVHPGAEQDYIRRHNPIWPELEAVLLEHGVSTYSIFHSVATNQLFAYIEIEDEARWAGIADTESCKRWWRHMADLMPHNNDYSPQSVDLPKYSICPTPSKHLKARVSAAA